VTRATIIWFVGGAVVGVAAAGLHVLRTDIGGSHTGTAITVAAWGATVLAALMLYRGIIVAAREQDEHARRRPALDRGARIPDWSAYDPVSRSTGVIEDDVELEMFDDGDDAYTFRRGHRHP
jgi:selenocysteine lyase/cysteine desulfurase